MTRGRARQAGGCHALPRGTEQSGRCSDEVCVPYKRESECTKLYRLIPKKVGSKSERRERVYKRAAETQRDFFRRGGARQAGGCHALPRGTELSALCDDEVCVPYKRKPVRLNRRVAAPAASATVNVKTVTRRAFDGRTMHGLKFTLCICSVNFMFPRRQTEKNKPTFPTAERPVCVPYKRKGTTPDRLKRQKVGSDSEAL